MFPWPSWEEVSGMAPPGARAVCDFEDFLGDWTDNYGTRIKVIECERVSPGSDDKVLKISMFPKEEEREIAQLLRAIPGELFGFSWGRYSLDFHHSHTFRLTWVAQATDPEDDLSADDRIWFRAKSEPEPAPFEENLWAGLV